MNRALGHLCAHIHWYRLNWARRTPWGWWDEWDDTVLQTQDSKFESWRSEVEHATSRSRRLLTKLSFTRGWGRNIFVSFKPPRPGTEPRTLAWKAAVLTTTPGPPPFRDVKWWFNASWGLKGLRWQYYMAHPVTKGFALYVRVYVLHNASWQRPHWRWSWYDFTGLNHKYAS